MPSLSHAALTRLLPLLRRNPDPADVPALRRTLIEANRKVIEQPPRRVRAGHEEHVDDVHGFPVRTLTRSGTAPRRTLVWIHGGSYVKPSHPRQWAFAARVADQIGARLVFPTYPLAPAATVEDSFDAMVDLVAAQLPNSPDGLVLAGDSAGGGYALAVAQALRDRGQRPDRLVLLAPWVDLTGTAPGTAEAAARDPWLSYDHLLPYAAFWAGGEDPETLADPRASPGLGDLSGLPPTLMLCGTRDLLQPGCDALFARAEQAEWELTYVVAPGLLHVYPLLPVPEARQAEAQIVAFLGASSALDQSSAAPLRSER